MRSIRGIARILLIAVVAEATFADATVAAVFTHGFWKGGPPGKYTWTGKGADSNWNTPANWCANAVPNNTHIAYFDPRFCAGVKCNVTLNVNPNVAGVKILANYPGAITQAAGVAMTVGTSAWIQQAGIFLGADGAISILNTFTLSGGSFQSTSATFTMYGNTAYNYSVTAPGAFQPNGGTVAFTPAAITASIYPGSGAYNNVTFRGS